jgi:hypothetical protein
MKRIKTLSMISALVFGAVATGCTTDPTVDDVDDGGGDASGGDDDGGGAEQRPLDAAGTYRLQSKFDIASGAPGTAGEVVNTIIAMTDDTNDPALWLVDQVIAAIPDGWSTTPLKYALKQAKPLIVGPLNNLILDNVDFLGTAVQVANNFGQMATDFGVSQTLEVTGTPSAYASKLTVVGAHFSIDGVESDHAFADHGVPEIVADQVGVTLATGKLGIGDHQFALSYGTVLRLGLDAAIIPMFEPGAHNLHELFAAWLNCAWIGRAIADAIPSGTASDYAGYCTSALNRAASSLYSKIATVDGVALTFGLSGTARALDTNKDRSVDTIHTGAWTGTLSYGGSTPAPLAEATFFGERM